MKVEYKVRKVTRYVVTRWHMGEPTDRGKIPSGVETKGEFDNADAAYQVAYVLCKDEHERLGYPPADERVQYPRHPRDTETAALEVGEPPLAQTGTSPIAG